MFPHCTFFKIVLIICWSGAAAIQTVFTVLFQGISLVLRIRFKNLILKFFGGKKI